MVKGISRQVIVVQTPEPKLFEQAIFILKENAEGVTDDALLKEAQAAIRGYNRSSPSRKKHLYLYGAVWASGGALVTGLIWFLSSIL